MTGVQTCALPIWGKPLPPGHRTAVRQIMQKAWFVIPDYDAVREGLAQAREILEDLRGGGYAVTTDYVEAKSLATVCVLILQEVEEERRRRSEERE